jgi:hypothetical protein
MNGWRTSSISGRAILRQVILKQNMEETEEIRPAPSHFKSDVWKHFGFKNKDGKNEIDMTNAICKHCYIAMKYCGNTTNLKGTLAEAPSRKTRAASATTTEQR